MVGRWDGDDDHTYMLHPTPPHPTPINHISHAPLASRATASAASSSRLFSFFASSIAGAPSLPAAAATAAAAASSLSRAHRGTGTCTYIRIYVCGVYAFVQNRQQITQPRWRAAPHAHAATAQGIVGLTAITRGAFSSAGPWPLPASSSEEMKCGAGPSSSPSLSDPCHRHRHRHRRRRRGGLKIPSWAISHLSSHASIEPGPPRSLTCPPKPAEAARLPPRAPPPPVPPLLVLLARFRPMDRTRPVPCRRVGRGWGGWARFGGY